MVDFPVFVGDTPDPEDIPTSGAVPAPEQGDGNKNYYLSAKGNWSQPSIWEPVTSISIPSGTSTVVIGKLNQYRVIRLTIHRLLVNANSSSILLRLCKGANGSTIDYTSGNYQSYVSGWNTNAGAFGSSGGDFTTGWRLTETYITPEGTNCNLNNSNYTNYFSANLVITGMGSPRPNEACIVEGHVGFNGTTSLENFNMFLGRHSDYVDTPERTGLALQVSGGVNKFTSGFIYVEGIRYSASFNNYNATFL